MRRIIGFFLVILVGLSYWSFFYEPSLLIVRHEKFYWNQRPVKIAFFSDLHAGSPFINLEYIEHLVLMINAENPDFIFIGGDLVINGVLGGHAIPFHEVAKALSNLKAKGGVFAVLGNHDWWNNTDEIRSSIEKIGIRILENESILVSINDRSKFNLIAVGDDMTEHVDLENAFKNAKGDFPKIVLTHDPGALLDLPSEKTFDLALAGHMHGGQVSLPFFGPLITPGRAPKRWAKGWTDLPQGKLFVTNGIGTSILPIRFNVLPEVVIFEFEHFR